MIRHLQVAALCISALISYQSIAAPVTATLTGETRLFFSGPFDVGTAVTATWTYDDAQAPDVDSFQSIFNNAAQSFSLTFDGYGTYTGENGELTQHQSLGVDNHEIYIGNGNGTLSGPVVGGLEILYFWVRFQGEMFGSQSVLTSGFTPDDAFVQDIIMRFLPVGGGSQVQVELTNMTFSFSAESVPAPGALVLLGFGLIGLGMKHRSVGQ